jgi:hypothetical protein
MPDASSPPRTYAGLVRAGGPAGTPSTAEKARFAKAQKVEGPGGTTARSRVTPGAATSTSTYSARSQRQADRRSA